MKFSLFFIFLTFSFANSRIKSNVCTFQPCENQFNHKISTNSSYNRINSKISGGDVAQLGQYPWHVHMTLYDDLGLKICGGALIQPKWVLTSGTCIVCASSALLHFGVVDRLSFNIPWMTHVTDRNHFIVHKNYDVMNCRNPFNDNIGLVFLQQGGDFLLNLPNVAIIPLPVDLVGRDIIGFTAHAAGFGATEDPQTSSSQFLRFIAMTVISTNTCNEFYDGVLDDYKICTNTAGGRSTCHGDFGAPLSTASNGRDVLIGVGSLRYFGGCQVEAPAVFTSVTKYLDWIDENIRNEPEDSTDCSCDCICHTCPASEGARNEL